MPLEDVKSIDIALTDAAGNPQLVITDSGQTRDPEQRLQLLLAKLTTYLRYIFSEEFAKEHPQSKPQSVSIKVMCALPPTDKMRNISRVRHPQHKEWAIPVTYEVFPGSGGAAPASEVGAGAVTAPTGTGPLVIKLQAFNNGKFPECTILTVDVPPFKELVVDITGCEFSSAVPPPDAVVVNLPGDAMYFMPLEDDENGRRYAMSAGGTMMGAEGAVFEGFDSGDHVVVVAKLLEPPQMAPLCMIKLRVKGGNGGTTTGGFWKRLFGRK
jgi:hypothetical protein